MIRRFRCWLRGQHRWTYTFYGAHCDDCGKVVVYP